MNAVEQVEAVLGAYGDPWSDWRPNEADLVLTVRDLLAEHKRVLAERDALQARVDEALAIEAWPANPATMSGYELDEAEGYNEAHEEFRRILSAPSKEES